MRVLLLGSGGQLGRELQRTLAARWDLVALDRAAADLGHAESLRAAIHASGAGAIVIAGAYTAVDRAESEPAQAELVNAIAPGVIGHCARDLGAYVVHYSTDYVFDGTKPTPYREEDPTAPLSVYGRTKRDGEHALAASGARHAILRTSWVVGRRGANFARTMLKLARERDRLRVVADQHGVPTTTVLLADLTTRLLERWAAGTPVPDGLYHAVPTGETTWFDYARTVLAAAERAGLDLRTASDAVEPITTAEYPTPARRPLNSRFATDKIRSALDVSLPAWDEALAAVLPDVLNDFQDPP